MHPLQKKLRQKVRALYPLKEFKGKTRLAEAYREEIIGYNEAWIPLSEKIDVVAYNTCNNAKILTGLNFKDMLDIFPEINTLGKRAKVEGTGWIQGMDIPSGTEFLQGCPLRIGQLREEVFGYSVYQEIFRNFQTMAVIPASSLDFRCEFLNRLRTYSLTHKEAFLAGAFYNPHMKDSNWNGEGKTFCFVNFPRQ